MTTATARYTTTIMALPSSSPLATLHDHFRSACVGRQRDYNHEDAPLAGHIANTDLAAVGPYGLASDRESPAKARPIAAAPVAKHLKQIAPGLRNPATLVFGLDVQPPMFGARPQYHAPSCWRVLEGVVQQVHHGRCEELRVCVD